MKGTYQPFIIKQAEEVLELLKEDIEVNDQANEDLCIILTKKFIDGTLNEGSQVFSSTEELDRFINLCLARQDLTSLKAKGLIDTYDDDESFFLTKKGKEIAEKMFKPGVSDD